MVNNINCFKGATRKLMRIKLLIFSKFFSRVILFIIVVQLSE